MRGRDAWKGCLLGGLALAGCLSPADVLNENFLQAVGLDLPAQRLPGEAPVIVLGISNETSFAIEAQLAWRDDEGEVQTFAPVVFPEEFGGSSVFLISEFCPIQEITLGSISDLSSTGAVVRLGAGSANDPFIEVEPFGILLREGVHYNCGDRIVFSVRPSNATPSGFRIFAEIERSGAQ